MSGLTVTIVLVKNIKTKKSSLDIQSGLVEFSEKEYFCCSDNLMEYLDNKAEKGLHSP